MTLFRPRALALRFGYGFGQLRSCGGVGRIAHGRRLRLNSFLFCSTSGFFMATGPGCRAYDPAGALSVWCTAGWRASLVVKVHVGSHT